MIKAYIEKINYYLPGKIIENEDLRFIKKIGIKKRHIASPNETAADLAEKAALGLLLNYDKKDIDFLIFCTQSPDYFLPTTACILQQKLGLKKNCGAFDYNLGCSGYIYGLAIAKNFIETGMAKQVLVLTGETYSRYIHENDNSVKPLFGDGGSATLIVGKHNTTGGGGINNFVFGTDGSGKDNLIVPAGGARNPYGTTQMKLILDKYRNMHTNFNLSMDGYAIMTFALETVPKVMQEILQKACLQKEDIDYYVFHQANKFMLEVLQKQCGLENLPYWNDVEEYGNTVSNSIPIALADLVSKPQNEKGLGTVMLIGFGVGYSWGGCLVDLRYLL